MATEINSRTITAEQRERWEEQEEQIGANKSPRVHASTFPSRDSSAVRLTLKLSCGGLGYGRREADAMTEVCWGTT